MFWEFPGTGGYNRKEDQKEYRQPDMCHVSRRATLDVALPGVQWGGIPSGTTIVEPFNGKVTLKSSQVAMSLARPVKIKWVRQLVGCFC